MSCQHCGIETQEQICAICSFLEDGKVPDLPQACLYCGAPVTGTAELKGLCHICSALLKTAVMRNWFIFAHNEWEMENIRLAELKRTLLH